MNNKENLPGKLDFLDPVTAKTLKETVAQGATDSEFVMFAEMCRATGLNPFKREIWFIKTNNGRVQMMTGINGFLAIANGRPEFDGMECDIKRNGEGRVVSAIARVYRKDRKYPSTAEALYQEYFRPNKYGNEGIWEKMPSVMLAKCAKSLALREAFPQQMNGLYTEEEMPEDFSEKSERVKEYAKKWDEEVLGQKLPSSPESIPAKIEKLKTAQDATVCAKPAELIPKPTPPPTLNDLKPAAALLTAFPGSTLEEKQPFYYCLDKVKENRKQVAKELIESMGGGYVKEFDVFKCYEFSTKLKNHTISWADVQKRRPAEIIPEAQDGPAWLDGEMEEAPISGENETISGGVVK